MRSTVDDLFAKLRAAKADGAASVAEPAAGESTVPEPSELPAVDLSEESPFVDRDEAMGPIEVNLSRRFKRALADEQNDVLDVLRRKEPVTSLDAVLPGAADHLVPYIQSIRDEVPAAALAGARSMSEEPVDRLSRRIGDANVVERCLETLEPEVVEPLRSLLATGIQEAKGNNAEFATTVRTVYREWKTQRLDEFAEGLVRAAYARGAYAAIVPGTPVRWVADPAHSCEHAAANAAAGVVRAGDRFPSGDVCPPAEQGCRCLLVIADR